MSFFEKILPQESSQPPHDRRIFEDADFPLDREYRLELNLGEGHTAMFKANCLKENGSFHCHIDKDGHTLDFYQEGVPEYDSETDSYSVTLCSRTPGQEAWRAKIHYVNPNHTL